jgi:hypothetical protein
MLLRQVLCVFQGEYVRAVPGIVGVLGCREHRCRANQNYDAPKIFYSTVSLQVSAFPLVFCSSVDKCHDRQFVPDSSIMSERTYGGGGFDGTY